MLLDHGGRALKRLGAHTRVPNLIKLRIPWVSQHGSQTVGDKLRSREGNSPDRQLRSLNTLSGKDVNFIDSEDVGLEAATI
jgi:hypothetical protein